MNQSHPNDARGISGSAHCQAANGQIGYQNIKTVKLDASNEGVRYPPVGAGFRSADTRNTSEILITQIQMDGVSLPLVKTPPSLAQQIADVQISEDTQLTAEPGNAKLGTVSLRRIAGDRSGPAASSIGAKFFCYIFVSIPHIPFAGKVDERLTDAASNDAYPRGAA